MKGNIGRCLGRIALYAALLGGAGAGWAADEEIPDVNPYSGNEKAMREGRSWYRGVCASCHGGKADGSGERGTGADLRKLQLGFKGFVHVVLDGRQTAGRTMQMPGWRGVLKNDDIFKIGAYLETLAIEGANWKEGVKH
jgi:mono/diheme cytochrome c family protein